MVEIVCVNVLFIHSITDTVLTVVAMRAFSVNTLATVLRPYRELVTCA